MTEIFVDNFAGGGGASTGIEIAIGRSVDIAINHDPAAIAMHRVNHPTTKHYVEDVWKVDPAEACAGRPVALAWFSPDCKHHSKAKGGKPVDKHIRGLAWVAVKWAKAVHPRVIMLENVEEFMDWGRLDENNRPNPKYKGETFRRFIRQLKHQGYNVEYRLLRACDYGAPTIRKRFFLIARCDGQPIVWPNPTHGDPDSLEVRAGLLRPWVPVADVLDFSLPCPSIFDTSEEIQEKFGIKAVRPLAENTLKRIARGVVKFVIDNPRPFIVQVNHSGDSFRGQEVSEPLDTITAKHGTGVVEPIIAPVALRNNENAVGSDVSEPTNTITAGGHHMLIAPNLIQYHSEQTESVRGQTIDRPVMTVDASNRYGLVEPFLAQIGYGEREGQAPRIMDAQKPLGTVVAQSNKFAMCSAFISKYYDGGYNGAGSSAEKPVGTITAVDHNAVCAAFVTQFNRNSVGQEVAEPLNTVTAGQGHFGDVRAFLVKYYGSGKNVSDLNDPAPTITAKDRLGLVTIEGQDYEIVDIGLRMLTPRELFNAQGFPPDYVIDVDADGKAYPKAGQVARCGNAVCPPIPTALVRANLPEYCNGGKEYAAS